MKMIITLEVEIDTELMFDKDEQQEVEWFEKEVMGGEFRLHTQEVGDELGEICKLEWKWKE